MRLLNTTTLELREFNFDALSLEVPFGYAILSHRWRNDEIDFKTLHKMRQSYGAGYEKITRFCRFAKSRGFSWVWIDTCCIDKRSSSELSEAINSMFRWYTGARECCAFLDDVSLKECGDDSVEALRRSEWFSRGWTLQELIAPKRVVFVSNEWRVIGRRCHRAVKEEHSQDGPSSYSARGDWHSDRYLPSIMRDALWTITAIPVEVLLDQRANLRLQSVAEKMSWMAGRRTTRIEDQAYCLLGLFNISMPPLYGEGLKAFDRLQAIILQSSSDESIFAWDTSRGNSWRLLAQRPDQFVRAANIRPLRLFPRLPYSITNQGLRFEFTKGDCVLEMIGTGGCRALEIWLSCFSLEVEHCRLCCLYLEQAACGHYIRKGRKNIEDSDGLWRWERSDGERPGCEPSDGESPRKRSRRDPATGQEMERLRGEGRNSEVIFIHMGQEHHSACRLSGAGRERTTPPLLPDEV